MDDGRRGPKSLLQRRRAHFDRTAEAWADAHLSLGQRQRRDLAITVAAPYAIRKTARGRSWTAVRWFWNVKHPHAKWHLLLALDRPPATDDEFTVAHAFLIPKTAVGTRQVIAYYDTEADRRTGTLLDRYRVEERKAA